MKISSPFHFKKKPKNSINPNRDWRIILIVFSFLCVGGAVYSAFLFYETTLENDTIAATSVSSDDTTTSSSLQNIVTFYSKKQKAYDDLTSARLEVSDPSL